LEYLNHRSILQDVYELLSPDGAISLMDMDPSSQRLQKLVSNPFAFAGFKSTEPWIQEYLSFDIISELKNVGFKGVTVSKNSPQHRTIVAYK